jgi:CRP-like cAMP-binding protein
MSLVAEVSTGSNGLHSMLDSIGLFQELGERRRRELLSCVEPRRYRRGELLYVEGAPSDELVLLMSGVVVLFRGTPQGRRATLAAVRSPGVLGEEVLADLVPRIASAEALGEAFGLALPRPALQAVMRESAAVCDAARRWLAQRLHQVTDQHADHVLLDLPARVAKTLLRLAERAGKPPLVVNFSQGLIAALAGGSRQSVNQTLQRYARRGWLRIEKARIVLCDPEALRCRVAGQLPESGLDLRLSVGRHAPSGLQHMD